MVYNETHENSVSLISRDTSERCRRMSSGAGTREDLLARMSETMRIYMARAVVFQDAVAKSVGLNSTDLQCANLLLLHGSATPGELAERSGLTAGGAVTAVIDRLERRGLVHRSRDTVDRRRVIITADAAELWRLVGPSYERITDRWNEYLKALTDNQIEFAITVLGRAADINAEEIDRLRA
jgi:DNA-binding MarR family transcriptional regulator